jgi:hypothetical protein
MLPVMARRSTSIPTALPASALRTLLATERDPHRRQRELVRASLVACPGKSRARGPLAA